MWSHLRNLYEPLGLPPKIPAAPNVKIGHFGVPGIFRNSPPKPFGTDDSQNTYCRTHRLIRPKTYFRKEVLSEMLR